MKWIPSHCGITGNEEADKAARGPADEDHSTSMKVPYTDFYAQIASSGKKLWLEIWKKTTESKASWYASLQECPPAQPWWKKIRVDSRKQITQMNRLRFGHCRTPTHLKRLRIKEDDKCPHCHQEKADLEHFIMNCSALNLQRLIFIAEMTDLEDNRDVPSTLQEILSNVKYYKPLYTFISNSIGDI
ncbi:hypothetical protein O0L34_g17946 [Tuta absoluta]|nr:hypothetical protein O0L34_g17946 [Tuta absoluta]